MESDEIFLPTLHTFAMNNIYTGSKGLFRFRIVPNVVMRTPKEVDFEKSSMFAQFGTGSSAMKKARWREETFPMSEEGKARLLAFLEANVPAKE